MNFTIPTNQKYLRAIAIVGIVLAFLLSSNSVYATEIVLSTAQARDDAWENDANVGFNYTNVDVWMETGSLASGRLNIATRFSGVNIPQGATIDSAVVSLKSSASCGCRPNATLYGEPVDNSPALTDVTGLARTSASVSWSPGNLSSNTRYSATAVTSIVQEIVDRGGWVSGNALTIIFIAQSGSNYNFLAKSFDSGVPADYPMITINFTVAAPITTTQAASAVSTATATGNGTTTALQGVDGDERGFVWGTTSLGDPGNVAPDSTSYDDFVSESGIFIEEAFTGDIDLLTETTTYYVRAFTHTADGGYGYGGEVSFTSDTTPSGLSVVMPQMIIFGVITWVVLLLILQVRWGIMNNPAGVLITGTLGLIVIAILIAIAG